MKRFSLIVTDSGPLITLAVAQSLDALLLARLPVIVPDMVRFEVIRDLSKPGAQEAADWIRLHEGADLRVASSEVFEECRFYLRPGRPPRQATVASRRRPKCLARNWRKWTMAPSCSSKTVA